uniref:Uncharacterized protein n=1 Tax=Oryza brachyantha TaxID=4533 RepID=J3MA58_ORYBR
MEKVDMIIACAWRRFLEKTRLQKLFSRKKSARRKADSNRMMTCGPPQRGYSFPHFTFQYKEILHSKRSLKVRDLSSLARFVLRPILLLDLRCKPSSTSTHVVSVLGDDKLTLEIGSNHRTAAYCLRPAI